MYGLAKCAVAVYVKILSQHCLERLGKITGFRNFIFMVPCIVTLINKIQQDATVCRYLFTAKLLYMFRVSISPIIRST